LNIQKIIDRKSPVIPWTEGEKIPWNEPEFSQRMLKEHLSQEHDAASRRFEIIDRQVSWIHQDLLGSKPSRILDLGCGPGFYSSRLGQLGHRCKGIDFSPASIVYAQDHDRSNTYVLDDVRSCEFGLDFDLAMMIYGEFNTFRRPDAQNLLAKAGGALKPTGKLLIELNSLPFLKRYGQVNPSWYAAVNGLFSDNPYLFMSENFWNDELQAATCRMYVVDAASGEVEQYADNHQAYPENELVDLVLANGFSKAKTLRGWPYESHPDDHFVLLIAEK